MSKYTIQLRYLLESSYDLGLDDYPIFQESYREGLNDKIKEHFYFREIGFETPAMFKHYLNRVMKEEMPYFNQLYESQLLQLQPLTTRNVTDTAHSESSGTSSSSGSGKTIGSDTPQGMLTAATVDAAAYASNAAMSEDESSSESTSEADATHTVAGYEGTDPSTLLKRYRETFLNIDMMVIEKLEPLFMGLW